MTNQLTPRATAQIRASALACLLMMAASPLAAQDAPGAPVAPGTATQSTTTSTEPSPEPAGGTQQAAEQPQPPQTTSEQAAPAAAPGTAQPVTEMATPAASGGTEAPQPAQGSGQNAPSATTAPSAAAPAGDAQAITQPTTLEAVEPVASTDEARDPSLPHDLSPMGMFMAADWIVKGVMIGLAFASVVTWTVLLFKMIELLIASSQAERARRRIEAAPSLEAALEATGRRRDPASNMVRQAADEYRRSALAVTENGAEDGVKERVASHVGQIEAVAGRRIGRGTGVLATIGSTAPFVGLFGTVWGIMNSFIGISEAQTTNLAVVAPGIAEALLATAIGLVAAIPAVVIYNVFARAITGYRLKLATAGAGVQRLISRDLDFRRGV